MADRKTFHRRLMKLGACPSMRALCRGKYFKEVWDTWESESTAKWLLERLAQQGYLKHEDLDTVDCYGTKVVFTKGALRNAYMFAHPVKNSRRCSYVHGKPAVDAMKQVVGFRKVSRALAKIKV